MTSSEAERHWNWKIAHSLLLCLNPPPVSTYPPSHSLLSVFVTFSPFASEDTFFFLLRETARRSARHRRRKERARSSTGLPLNLKTFAWSHGCLRRVERLHKTRTSKRRFELYFLIQTAAGHCVCVCARQREVVWGEDTVDNEMFPYSDTVEGTGAECYSPHEQYIVTLLYPAMKKNIHCRETLTVLI